MKPYPKKEDWVHYNKTREELEKRGIPVERKRNRKIIQIVCGTTMAHGDHGYYPQPCLFALTDDGHIWMREFVPETNSFYDTAGYKEWFPIHCDVEYK